MTDNKCDIVKDLLPLYVDDALSESSKKFVEEHLENCEDCNKEYEIMISSIEIPKDTQEQIIEKVNNKIKNKKRMVGFFSIAFTFIILLVFYNFSTEYSWVIPYTKESMEIVEYEDKTIEMKYDGKYDRLSVIPKKEGNTLVLIVQYKQTLYSKYLDSGSNGDREKGHDIYIDEKYKGYDSVKVYYVEKDFNNKDFEKENEEKFVEKLIQEGILIY